MSDPSLDLLYQELRQADADSLWVADEHIYGSQPPPFAGKVITNRYDVAQALKNVALDVAFTDFDFSPLPAGSLTKVYFRVCKEKPVAHWVINQAFELLRSGGTLVLSGEKNEGIKTYVDKAGKLFGCKARSEKHGSAYQAHIHKKHQHSEQPLDDQHYTELRPINPPNEQTPLGFLSKPGVFGWNKIDKGSAFLVAHLEEFLAKLPHPPRNILDLGCGYGYIACSAIDSGAHRIVATDSNAAAVKACAANFQQPALQASGIELVALTDNCATSLTETFDCILCNPPFHQGFAVQGELTGRFLSQTARLLHADGLALFVVNQFIPLERRATEYFQQVETLSNNGSFKLVVLGKPLA